jgi:uncharacterized repeat protein (TIGR01451 family)
MQKKQLLFIVIHAMCIMMIGLSQTAWSIGTSVNQLIQNQATATYVDANNNSHTAQSNLATIVVGQVYSASMGQDRSSSAAAGQPVYFSHYVKNSGNGTDEYTVELLESITGQDDSNFTALKVYLDMNHNGEVNDGEDMVAIAGTPGTVTIEADQKIGLIVEVRVPSGALENQVLGATLKITSAHSEVTDESGGKGLDGLDNTNEDRVTVTSNAVMIVTKSATYSHNMTLNDISDDTVIFTITIKNIGQSSAYNVDIQDVLDLTKLNVTSVNDIILEEVNGDFVDGPSADEGSVGTDTIQGFAPVASNNVNDEVNVTNVFGIRGHDDVLPPDTTVSFKYRVSIKPELMANTSIENEVKVIADLNDDGDSDDENENILSNKTIVHVYASYSLIVSDTGAGMNTGVNDGGDDDNIINDDQVVDRVASGEQVVFTHTIKNNGNIEDTYELTYPNAGTTNNSFPSGTVFSFWHEGGNTALLDSNNDGTVDTGPLLPKEMITIVVKAQLPAGAYDNDGTNAPNYTALLTATSAGMDTMNDTTTSTVFQISPPGVDLTNSPARGTDSSDGDPLINKHAYTTGGINPTTTKTGNPGANIVYPLTIENDSGVPDAFQLACGSSWDGSVLGHLPEGWSMVFHDEADNVITTTPALPAHATFLFHAHIILPSDPIKCKADYETDFDGDGEVETIDGNSDGDGDYPIFLKIKSINTGATDIKLDALDVNDIEKIALVANQTGQIQPGGSVTYNHTLRNDGNTVETLILKGTNSLVTSGWGNSILVDTTGDGIPNKPFNALSGTDSVYFFDINDNYVWQVFGGSGIPNSADKIRLNPGEKMPVSALVFSPSSAPDGTLDVLSAVATYNYGVSISKVIDQSTVILGQLRLIKTAALDADCNGEPDTNLQKSSASTVKPEQCVIWQVVVTNAGTENVDMVKVHDNIPGFTQYRAGSLKSGFGNAGTNKTSLITLSGNTDADDDESGSHPNGYNAKQIGTEVIFHVGTGASQNDGGSIAPGESVSMRFCTQVE